MPSNSPLSGDSEQGYGSVLRNQAFLRLWIAQTLGLTSQNGIHFVQMVLIEHLTGSTTQMSLMILAFSLPGVLFSAIAGVVVDRWPKSLILNVSNVFRVISTLGYILVLRLLCGWDALLPLYAVTFVVSSISQFFGPALWAKVPMIIGEERLMAANNLFNLTYAISQAAGLIVLAPLAVKLIGIEGTFIAIAVTYLISAILIAMVPRDTPAPHLQRKASLRDAWQEISDGWQYVITQRGISMPMAQLTLIATLIMVLAMVAPGFSTRVLGMAPEDAIFIFAPAGIGMLASTFFLGRYAHRFSRETWVNTTLLGTALGFAALGLVSRAHMGSSTQATAAAPFGMLVAIMVIALVTGFCMATANTVAQTALQERTVIAIRGRVYSVQFLLANLIGIPPLVGLGTAADRWGIPIVCFILAGLVLAVWLPSLVGTIALYRSEHAAKESESVLADHRAGKPRVLILASQTDLGAQYAAQALSESLEAHDEAPRVLIMDGLDFLPRLSAWQNRFYHHCARQGSWIWRALRRQMRSPRRVQRAADLLYALWGASFRHALACYAPDIVLSMQPILTQLLARAIQSAGDTRSRLVTVVTELAQLHPVWLCPEADLTVVSNETMQELALAAGLSAERVLRLGLPIRSTFSSQETYPQDLLRRALGWPSALPTVLLVHGSEPVNPTWLLCQALARGSVPFHLALVTGHDERLRRRLAGLSWNGPVSLYGFVDDLPEMMLAADLLITKAGSTLVAEGLAAGLPMLLLRGAAVDAGNTAYVVGAGIGALCESPTQLVSVLNEWLRVGNPLLGQMAERARALAQPLAAERIARAVWHLHRPA